MSPVENNNTTQEAIVEPTSLDILHGREYMCVSHIGNRCFRLLISFILEEYKALSTLTNKARFFNSIVKSIFISGGRFLRRNPGKRGSWEMSDFKKAEYKVWHSFRHFNMKRQPTRMEESLTQDIKHYFDSAEHFDWKGIVYFMINASALNPKKVINEPTSLDILRGREDFSIHHIGNICFHEMISNSVEHYVILTTRSEKSKFLSSLVHMINNSGGRFLHKQVHDGGGLWEEDHFQEAKTMVGQALRDFIKKTMRLNGSLLLSVSDAFCRSHHFDWKSMVEETQLLQSEINNCFAREEIDFNCCWGNNISCITDSTLREILFSAGEIDCQQDTMGEKAKFL